MEGRLISAEALKRHYAWWEGGSGEMTLDEAKRNFDTIIDIQPTIGVMYDHAPIEVVKHGHWELNGEYVCSNCGCVSHRDKWRYCPYCGAKMDEVEDG